MATSAAALQQSHRQDAGATRRWTSPGGRGKLFFSAQGGVVTCKTGIRRLFLALAACALALPLAAQKPPEDDSFDPRELPFRQWLASGEQEQIPWRVRVSRPVLTQYQRQAVTLEVEVSSGALARLGEVKDLVLLARLADHTGKWFDDGSALRSKVEERLPRRTRLVFSTRVLVQPGEYRVGIVLLERTSGARSVARRTLRVPPLQNDPLAAYHRELPPVDFLRQEEGLDVLYRPALPVPFRLQAPTRQRVHVEVLVNFSPAEFYAGRRPAYWANVATLVSALKILSQLELPNGQLNVSAVDLLRQRVFFRQEQVRSLDWPRLREAILSADPGVIDARSLENRRQAAAFFRELLGERLEAPAAPRASAGSPPGAHSAEPPQRVVIVLSTGFLFPGGSDRTPVRVPRGCPCRVYFLENRITAPSLWDHLRKMMDPLPLRRLVLETPRDFREALAVILEDLRKM